MSKCWSTVFCDSIKYLFLTKNSHAIYVYSPLSKSMQFTKIKSFLRVACVAHFVWRMMKSRHYRDRASIARSSRQKRPARYTRSMLSGVSRPTIAHKTRLWAGVGIVIQSQINLPAIPRGHDKKISLPRDSSPAHSQYADIPRALAY